VGTYVIAFAIFALPEVGPEPIPDQNVMGLLVQPLSIAWTAVLCGTMVLTILAMILLALCKTDKDGSSKKRPTVMLLVLVTAQVTSAVIGTSVGKVFAVAEGWMIGLCLGLFVVTAVVNVGSLMMAAASVNQGIFVPLQTCATLAVNMLTGLLIWEDWRVVDQWVAYCSLYLLMALGIYMLTPGDVLELYKRHKHIRIAKAFLRAQDLADHDRASHLEAVQEAVVATAGNGSNGEPSALGPSIWSNMLKKHHTDISHAGDRPSSKFKSIVQAASVAKAMSTRDVNLEVAGSPA